MYKRKINKIHKKKTQTTPLYWKYNPLYRYSVEKYLKNQELYDIDLTLIFDYLAKWKKAMGIYEKPRSYKRNRKGIHEFIMYLTSLRYNPL